MGSGDTDAAGYLAAAGDLDALIGDIRREAARRRAVPDFPVDEEARLSAEMDGQGPAGVGGADVAAVTAALRELERSGDAKAAEVAGLAASALRALSIRLGELERRAPREGVRHPGGGAPTDDVDLLATWGDDVVGAAAAGAGRVLVVGVGSEVERWVNRLGSAGTDVYGLDAGGGPFGDRDVPGGPVRTGEPLDHLRRVSPAAIRLAAVVGPLPGPAAVGLDELAGELARSSERIVVCAEAPWAWRRRVGDASADTSPSRSVGPEAWLQALAAAGWAATGRYDRWGRTFMLDAGSGGRATG